MRHAHARLTKHLMIAASASSGDEFAPAEPTKRALSVWVFVLPAVILSLIFLSLFFFYRNYFPYSDEPAAFAGGNQGVADWFTHGVSELVIPYPEWTVPYTDFMRPVTSLITYLTDVLFGKHYILWFVFVFALQYSVVLMTVEIGRWMGLPILWLTGLAALVAINPSFVNDHVLLWRLGFPDPLIGLLSLAAFRLLCGKRYAAAVATLLVGVFAKESMFIFTVAACITTYFATRRKLLSLSMLLPVATWLLVRRIWFVGSLRGVYVLPAGNLRATAMQMVKGLLYWPTDVVGSEAIRLFAADHSVRSHLPDLILVAANIVLWIALAAFAWKVLQAGISPSREKSLFSLFVWLAGALAFGMIGLSPQYGSSIFPLECLVFALVCFRAKDLRAKALAGASLAILTGAFLWEMTVAIPHANTDLYYPMRELVSAMKRYSSAGTTVYVLNSALSYNSPQFVTAYFHLPGRLVVLNEFAGCIRASGGSTTVKPAEGNAVIESVLPSCASVFLSGIPTSKVTGALQGSLARGSFASYSFPDGRVLSMALRSGEPIIDYGKRIRIELKPESPNEYIVLYYDWAKGKFNCAGPGCGAVQSDPGPPG